MRAPRERAVALALTGAHAHGAHDEADALPLLLAQVRRFLSREVDAASIDRLAAIPAGVRAAAADVGLFALTVPRAYGGAGLSLQATCAVVDELARVDRSVAVLVGLHAGLGTRPLVELGTPAARERYLPALATGARIASFAATEPEAGSDLAAVRTTLRRDARGTLRLEGEKAYVTNGGFAGLYTVLAHAPGEGGARAHALVAVPSEAPGVHVGREEDKLGLRGSSTVSLRFDATPVADDAVLDGGAPGAGLAHAHGALAWGRTLMAAGCAGTARAAFDTSASYALTRRQFSRPIADFAAVRAQLAELAAQTFALETLVRYTAAHEPYPEALAFASLTAKVVCSEGAFEACDRAVQLHGALGYLEPAGVARMLRDCRVTRIFEGANDVLLVRAGAALLAGAAGAPGALCDALGVEPSPAREALSATRARLAAALQETRARYGVSAVHRQLALQGLARAHAYATTADAALARGASSRDEAERALAEHAADAFARRSERALDDAARAHADEARAQRVCTALFGARLGAPKAPRERRPPGAEELRR